jgi:lipopolysaccharide export system protein LptA
MLRSVAVICALLLPGALTAQTELSLGGMAIGAGSAVDIRADALAVDQATGQAVFSGNVVVIQGDVRIGAGEVEVTYDAEGGAITRLVGRNGVTFVTATQAAEAEGAEYDLAAGVLVLTGGVLMTEGRTALSAERMTINLRDGSARLEGGVRTTFLPEGE